MYWLKQNNIKVLALLCFFIFPSLIPLFRHGFFTTDDGNWMIIRFSAFYEALKSGQFPVRFLPRLNFGYGYPFADFLYPLFMYFAIPVKLLGFDFITTIKIIIGMSLVFSGIFCFYWLKKLFSTIPAFVGSICFVFFPYHLWDVYKRGSVGESLALAIIPFIFLQIEENRIFFIGIGIALLILSHNTLSLLFLPLILSYMLFIKKYSGKNSFLSCVLGFGMSLFFWLPAVVDTQYTVFNKTLVSDFSNYFISLKNIDLLGIISLIGLLGGAICYYKKKSSVTLFFLLCILLSLFFSTPVSYFFWQYTSATKIIQFPFRFVSIISFGIPFLLAVAIHSVKKNYQLMSAVFFLFLLYLYAWNYFPKNFNEYPDSFYSTNMDTTTVQNEYMPKWVQTRFTKPAVDIVDATISSNLHIQGTRIQFLSTSTKNIQTSINIIYFPGWVVDIDGKKYPVSYTNTSGLIQFIIPAGIHRVNIYFRETYFRLICDIISLCTCMSGMLFIRRKKYALF